jgi:hypothetical protein
MKVAGIFMTIIASILLMFSIGGGIIGHYQLEKSIMSYWDLADKASTIEKKSEYIDKFVEALNKEKYEGKYNAIFLETPNNSFDTNYEMLKTFQFRLKEIQTMDIKSFEYQTAIQQITQQEQGEAGEMLSVFIGIWWKTNYFLLWNWICAIQVTLMLIVLICGVIIWLD